MIDDFAADGQLAKAIPGFKPREPQRQMAVAVSEAIEASRPLVVEAGTGTGKTYAYLAPALRAKKKVVISTGSRKRCRISFTAAICPPSPKRSNSPGKLALLKGRSSYLCLERLEQQALAGGDLPVQTLQRCDPPALLVESNPGWRYRHLRQRRGRLSGTAAGDKHQR